MQVMMGMQRPLAVALAAVFSTAAMAAEEKAAADGEVQLEQVVVTTTRSQKAVEKIPGAVTVVTRREIEEQTQVADDPSRLLATTIAGFSPSRGKISQVGESFRGRAPLILLDGIPQTNPLRYGMREGYFADMAIIERVEVLAGPSALHGLGATGGLINYLTRTAKDPGTRHELRARMTTQFEPDSHGWKLGYTLLHKGETFDALVHAGALKHGMGVDGNGRRLGIDAVQGDSLDSRGGDLFVKVGGTFGTRRLQASINRYEIENEGDYVVALGNRAAGIPTSSVRGTQPGRPARTEVTASSADYRDADLAGGTLTAQVFSQRFSALYGAGIFPAMQDAAIAPVGTLIDQSEVVARKLGAKLSWVRPDVGIEGLEFTGGLDWLRDNTEQRLAQTGRTWVPPLKYTSVSPFAQLDWERGPFTLRGGVRHENVRLEVNNFRTLASYGGGREVGGGRLSFRETLFNLGGIFRTGAGASVFVSYSEGFGLPDVGLVLRGVNRAAQSVGQLVALEPVVTKSWEFGGVWRGRWGHAGASVYRSRSDVGSVLRLNAAGLGYVERIPVEIDGWEMNGEFRPGRELALTALYAATRGKTAAVAGAPLDVDLGARQQGPDKLVLGARWTPREDVSALVQATRLFSRHANAGRRIGGVLIEENFNGYTLVDASASWKTRWGTFGAGIENLFDRQYIGYYAQSHYAIGNEDYFAGRGRTYTLSWKQSF